MFAIAHHGNGCRTLLRGTPEDLSLLECLYDEIIPLRVRTKRGALAVLHHNLNDVDDLAVRAIEKFAWQHAHRLESLSTSISK